MQSELANWFGKDFNNLHIAFISNLGTNASVMAIHGLVYPVSIEGATKYWRRNIPYLLAVSKFIEDVNAYKT